MLRKHIIVFLLFIMLFSQNIFSAYSFGEFDKIATVEWVYDGDTFRTTDDESIRLADIDTPEINESGYQEATNYMISIIKNKAVFLDIDDKYVYDDEGKGSRLVCVVYVDYNQTHYLNVNKALLESDLAVIWEHDNEFNPYTWTLYVSKNDIPEFPSWIILPIFLVFTFSVIVIKKKLIQC
jgi:micrococcal nuclease